MTDFSIILERMTPLVSASLLTDVVGQLQCKYKLAIKMAAFQFESDIDDIKVVSEERYD